MPAIVDFPTVVQEALALFGALFDTEPARRHFAAYLTGLIVAENKTISGIFYSANSLQNMANVVFSGINQAGDILSWM